QRSVVLPLGLFFAQVVQHCSSSPVDDTAGGENDLAALEQLCFSRSMNWDGWHEPTSVQRVRAKYEELPSGTSTTTYPSGTGIRLSTIVDEDEEEKDDEKSINIEIPWVKEGQVFAKNGDYESAIDVYRQAVRAEPFRFDLWNVYAAAHIATAISALQSLSLLQTSEQMEKARRKKGSKKSKKSDKRRRRDGDDEDQTSKIENINFIPVIDRDRLMQLLSSDKMDEGNGKKKGKKDKKTGKNREGKKAGSYK
ncbi:unnamed protein product, partial [Amoebophrya sp. A25]